jgi:hypothetical protein
VIIRFEFYRMPYGWSCHVSYLTRSTSPPQTSAWCLAQIIIQQCRTPLPKKSLQLSRGRGQLRTMSTQQMPRRGLAMLMPKNLHQTPCCQVRSQVQPRLVDQSFPSDCPAPLRSFAKTSGGTGFPIVVPSTRRQGWTEVKAILQAVAQYMASQIAGALSSSIKAGMQQRRI